MKILMVIDSMFLGGLETHVVTLSKELLNRGHQVYLSLGRGIALWQKVLRELGVVLVDSPAEIPQLDLIHVHVWGEAVPKALAWQTDYQLPLVATCHGLVKEGITALSNKATLICVSQTVQEHLGVAATIIENGVDLNDFQPTPLPFNRRVAWLGRVEGIRWLTLENIFQACTAIGLKCLVAGAFLKPEQVRLFHQYPEVEWLGPVLEVSAVLKKVDLVFSTSRGIREAMTAGRIAVVANNIWYGGLVTPQTVAKLSPNSFMAWQDGLLWADQIKKDLEELYQEPARMQELAAWSATYGAQNFSATQMAEATLAVYQKVLGGQS